MNFRNCWSYKSASIHTPSQRTECQKKKDANTWVTTQLRTQKIIAKALLFDIAGTPNYVPKNLSIKLVLESLIEKGTNVNTTDNFGNTSLHLAAGYGNSNIVDILIEFKANLNALNTWRDTPLLLALKRENPDFAKIYIKKGADVNAKNEYGITALHLAIRKGYIDIAWDLIESEADVNAPDKYQRTPIHKAAESNNIEAVKLLIPKVANVNAKDNDGITALHLAARCGNLEIVQLLIKNGANVNAKDKYGNTALHWAIRIRNIEIARTLIKNGADVNAKDGSGWAPFYWVVIQKHLDSAELLIENGAEVTVKNSDECSLLDLAATEKNNPGKKHDKLVMYKLLLVVDHLDNFDYEDALPPEINNYYKDIKPHINIDSLMQQRKESRLALSIIHDPDNTVINENDIADIKRVINRILILMKEENRLGIVSSMKLPIKFNSTDFSQIPFLGFLSSKDTGRLALLSKAYKEYSYFNKIKGLTLIDKLETLKQFN